MLPVLRFLITLVAVLSLLSGQGRAMSMIDFAKMNNDDEGDYVVALVGGAAQVLKESGHPEQASKVNSLFQDSGANGGFRQFAIHLKMLRALNVRNATNPNNHAHEYLVEDAMELTLKDAGILVSAKSLMQAGENFQPSGPPRGQVTTGP